VVVQVGLHWVSTFQRRKLVLKVLQVIIVLALVVSTAVQVGAAAKVAKSASVADGAKMAKDQNVEQTLFPTLTARLNVAEYVVLGEVVCC